MGDAILILVVIFLFVLPIVMYGIWTSHKQEMRKLNSQLDDSEKQRYENEITAVKKRLEVLEAIVTDRKYQLDQEIVGLRSVDKNKAG